MCTYFLLLLSAFPQVVCSFGFKMISTQLIADISLANMIVLSHTTIMLLFTLHWRHHHRYDRNGDHVAPRVKPGSCALLFWIISRPVGQLHGTYSQILDELRQACNNIFSSLHKDWLVNVFRKWVTRQERCIGYKGRCFEKDWLSSITSVAVIDWRR